MLSGTLKAVHSDETRRRALAMVAEGRSLRSVSLGLGVSRAAIREWMVRGDTSPVAPCPVPLDPDRHPAYAALLGYYLGDGCLGRNPRTWSFRVSCDATYSGIIDDVVSCMVGVRPGCRVGLVSAPGATVVQSYWKHWPCLFPQHGPGRKHERALPMECWQWRIVSDHPGDFLRGLFHSDGARVRNWATRRVGGRRGATTTPAGSSSTGPSRSSAGASRPSTSSRCRGDGRTAGRSRCPAGTPWPGSTS